MEQGATRLIEIQGEHLRPYMRISFGDQQAASFQFYGAGQAFVPAPSTLEPGAYDVVLYDYMREVARLPKALSISGPMRPPTIQLRVRGAFIGQTEQSIAELSLGEPWNATEGVTVTLETKEPARPSVARVRISDTTVSVPMAGQLELPATVGPLHDRGKARDDTVLFGDEDGAGVNLRNRQHDRVGVGEQRLAIAWIVE